MKRLPYLALTIIVLFLCTLIMGVPSHAQEEETIVSPGDSPPIEITDIVVNKRAVTRLHLLMRGESSASLQLPQLEGTINFYREGGDSAEKDICYSVDYATEEFDLAYGDQTGLFFLKIPIILEDERYVMAPEVSTEISIPIFLYDPNQPSFLPALNPKLNNYDSMEAFHIMTDVHTDLQQLEDVLNNKYPYQRFYLYFEDGYYLDLPNSWDLTAVETAIPGIYPTYRRPELPQGVLMEKIPEAVCSINVQDPETFTLSSPISFGNNIVIRWQYPTPDPSLFRLLYRIGDGDWIVDTNEYFMCLQSEQDGRLSLFLNPWEMEKDIHYQFQLEYDGVPSSIFNLCVNEDGFYIPNEGDEDGGDRDSQTPPDVIQPAPTPPQPESDSEEESSAPETKPEDESSAPEKKPDEASFADESKSDDHSEDGAAAVSDQPPKSEAETSPEPSAPAEADTSTSSTWSGSRIQQYLKASPKLPLIFEKGLIRVEIPADSPEILNLSDSDFLHVEIQALSEDTLSLAACLNKVPLTGIPMTVTMPWTKEDKAEDLRVQREADQWVEQIDASDTKGSITFTVTQSGIYTILSPVAEEPATEEEWKKDIQPSLETDTPSKPTDINPQSVMEIPAIVFFISISVIAFLYYKRKKD